MTDILKKITVQIEDATRGPRYLILAALVALIIYLPGQRHGLWRTSEARDCEIAREMLETGNIAVPHFNGQVFLEKPPLFYASLALSMKIFGESANAARVPSTLFAMLTLIGIAVIGKKLYDERLGLFMAVIVGTTTLFLKRGHEAYMDVMLACAEVWALAAFLSAYRPFDKAQKLLPLVAFYLLLTVSFYIKGLVGPLVPLLTVGTYLLWQRDFRAIYRLHPWLGIVVFLALTAPWHYDLWRQARWEYLDVFYIHNHWYRFVPSDEVDLGHHTIWYWYLWSTWKFFAPWSLLLPPAILALFHKGFRAWFPKESYRFAVSWALPPFLFFTVSSTKREDYLLPIYGAFALLIAAGVLYRFVNDEEPLAEKIYGLVFAGLMAGLALYVPAAAVKEFHGSWLWFGLAALVSAGTGLGLIYAMINRPAHRVWAMVMTAAVAAGFAGSAVLLQVEESDRDQSVFSQKVAELTTREPKLYALGPSETERAFLGFFCKRVVTNLGLPPDPARLPGPGQRFPIAIVARTKDQVKDRQAALEKLGMKIEEALHEDVGQHRLCVLWWVSLRSKN